MSISFPNRLVFILVVAVLLPTLLINLATFSFIKKEMQADATSWLQDMTLNTGKTMDNYVRLLSGITKNPAYDFTLNNILEKHLNNREGLLGYSYEDTAQINGWLSMMLATDRSNIASVEIFDRNGNRFHLGSQIADPDTSWIQRTKALAGAAYLFPPIEEEDGRALFAISRLLYNPQTFHEIGMVRMYYRLDFTLDAGRKLLNQNGNLYLVNDRKQVLFDLQHRCLGRSLTQCAGSDHFQSRFVSDVTNWTLVTAIPKSQLFLKVESIQRLILLVNLFFFLVALITVVGVSYRISLPLKRLSRLMLNAPKHQFNIEIPDTRRTDEIGVITASFKHMIGRIHELIREVLSIERRRKRSEIASLQAQINPHFLYNTLSAIVMQAEIDGNYNISTMASKLGKLLRYSIGKEEERVTVREECAYIQLYIEVMKYRYPKLILDLEAEEAVLDWPMMKLLFQPIVENAIIHGIVPSGQEGAIRIEIAGDQESGTESLLIRIRDSGAGMSEDQLRDLKLALQEEDVLFKEHLGVRNVYGRIQLAYSNGRYSFDIDSALGQGTTYTIRLPRMDHEAADHR
ncbi:sensor histidine kinase [Cohnella caldifontis]|uniref:sensor histidine kinase n=1 Tax=Cohnella caldifontis TaxID=3027471 RepID=UPI0023ECC500|nr:histidine kinase [Cohnella sp. YIM B05605]